MSNYFSRIKSFEDLKDQYRELARKNHPDCGGSEEAMKAINAEYDTLFMIWQHKHNETSDVKDTETAQHSRRSFYTAYGWAGKNFDPDLGVTEIAARVRAYVKAVYPEFKFSIRSSFASMCSEITVYLTKGPASPYKTWGELSEYDLDDCLENARYHGLVDSNCFDWNECFPELKKAYEEKWYMKVKTDKVRAMFGDIDAQVNSYRMSDCDGQIDYFCCNFYYFDAQIDGKYQIAQPKTKKAVKAAKGAVAQPA